MRNEIGQYDKEKLLAAKQKIYEVYEYNYKDHDRMSHKLERLMSDIDSFIEKYEHKKQWWEE